MQQDAIHFLQNKSYMVKLDVERKHGVLPHDLFAGQVTVDAVFVRVLKIA
jgi:hypothetical protein